MVYRSSCHLPFPYRSSRRRPCPYGSIRRRPCPSSWDDEYDRTDPWTLDPTFHFIFPSSCSLFRQRNIVFFLEALQTLLELWGVAFGVLAALIFAHDGFEEISVSDQGGNNVGRKMRAVKLAGFVLLQKFDRSEKPRHHRSVW